MSEELIYKVGVEGTNELNKLENSVDKAGKSVGKTKLYMSELRTELRKARGDMIKYAEGTEEYNRALARGSQIISQINDANSKMRIGVQDLGDTTRNVTSTMVGFAGGFQVVQSAMSLFGVENEETIKTVLKLQQTMAIVQGLGAFAQGINDAQNLLASFRASNHQMNEDLKHSSDTMEGVTKSSDAMGDSMKLSGKETSVLGSNLAGNVSIGDKLSESLKEQSDARQKSIDLAKEAVFTNENVIDVKQAEIDQLFEEIEVKEAMQNTLRNSNHYDQNHIKLLDEQIQARHDAIGVLKEEGRARMAQNKGHMIHIENLEKEKEELIEATKAAKANESQAQKLEKSMIKAGKGISTFTKSILKSLVTMGGFLIAITLATLAVSWLIKKITEIPESLKIKLEVDTEASNNLVSDMQKARIFAIQYNQAVRDGNENRIKQLKKIGKDEYDLNQKRLDAIAKNVDAWRDAFKDYLTIARATYYNEALAKKKSETEANREIQRERHESAMKALLFAGKIERKGIRREANKAAKEFNKLNKEIETLNKIKYKRIPSDKVEDDKVDDLSTDTVKTSKAPGFGLRKPGKVEDDLQVEYLKERNIALEGYTNEELVIMEEADRKFNVQQDDSLVKYTEFQIKVAEARKLDLEKLQEAKEIELSITSAQYDENLKLQNKQLEEETELHNYELENLRNLTQQKFEIEQRASKLLEDRASTDPKNTAKIKAIDAEIEALNELYKANDASIESTQKSIDSSKEEIKIIKEKLKKTDEMPEKIKELNDELDRLNLNIKENSAFLVDSLAKNTQAMMEQATFYVDTMAESFRGLESMTNDFMQAEDNKLAKEKNNLELSQAYREADSEQQQQMMYELELANYEAKKKTFETNKAFQIGEVVTTSAANQMDIIKAWLDPKTGGPLSPANIAVAAAATIANVTTTVGSIKQIASTSLEKPVPPLSGAGGSGGPGANIALSPNKTSLTSKEENLNSMYKSGKMDDRETVVKVSEINDVQKRVRVREKNSSY